MNKSSLSVISSTTISTNTSKPYLTNVNKSSTAESPLLLRHPPFGRVIAKDLSPAITPESSPLNKKKAIKTIESINNKKNKTLLRQKSLHKTNSASSSRSSTPSPPRELLPVPQPVPKLVLKKKAPPKPPAKVVNLKNFEKSLQLIGIHLPASREEDGSEMMKEREAEAARSPSPTLRTRLKERTKSLSDIKKALDEGLPEVPLDKFKVIKRDLCDAVFEEWYFKKLALETESKLQAREERAKRELVSESKKEKADANFKNWLRSKKEQRAVLSGKDVTSACNPCKDECEKIKELQNQKEKEWLDKKNKELRERRRLERQALKEKTEMEKERKGSMKTENAKHFEEWSRARSKKMKEQKLKEREKRLEELEHLKERKEVAEISFKAWLAKKKSNKPSRSPSSQDAKNKAPCKEMAEQTLANHPEENNLKSQEAFNKWLESLELRDEIRTADEEFQLREMWKPPWYPPGH